MNLNHHSADGVAFSVNSRPTYRSRVKKATSQCDDASVGNGFLKESHTDIGGKERFGNGTDENRPQYIDSGESTDMQTLYRLAASFGLSNSEHTSHEFYYGLFVPHESRLQSEEEFSYVFTDKAEALKAMKQWKKSRFKSFRSWKEAVAFAENGIESTTSSCMVGMEKPMPFKGPKAQDMIRFRKAIECGDIEVVKNSIDENPRYLFSSGDTPSILQEGCRYNALHVAAKTNQAAVANLVLNSVQSLSFLGRLFDDCDESALRARRSVLLDLYLNTPDKSCNETPLHFAVKYGAVEVVEILTSYAECQRHLKNKHGESVQDLICSRIPAKDEVKKAIMNLLEDRYFLPVLRYEDNSLPPRVGTPFSPVKPLEVKEDPLSPRLEIQALAGPMTKVQANDFRKKWRTPPAGMRASALRLSDPEKGLERVGRNIASDFKVPWKEYWSFLDTFVDLSSSHGLSLLEKFLQKRFEETSHEASMVDIDLPRNETKQKEEDILTPISELCRVFRSFAISDTSRPAAANIDKRRSSKDAPLSRVISKKTKYKGADDVTDDQVEGSHQFSPLLCVERSCQVFGKRIATAIIHVCTTCDANKLDADSIKDTLDPEVKHFQVLVTGYLEDARFNGIDFRVVHARVAAVAGTAVRQQLTPRELQLLLCCLREVGLTDGTVSDEEDLMYSTRESQIKTLGAIIKSHVLCLSQCLIYALTETGPSFSPVSSEVQCEELWKRVPQCACAWDAKSHLHARITWRRRHKMAPKLLAFKSEEGSSVEESWRSCDDTTSSCTDDEDFKTPPSSPIRKDQEEDEVLYDTISQPDTFIYPGDRPSKTDLAVVDAISSATITAQSHPAIYRWRHLVKLHEDHAVPYGQSAPSPGAWHRRRLMPQSPSPRVPESPERSSWERITGPFTPRRSTKPTYVFSPSAR